MRASEPFPGGCCEVHELNTNHSYACRMGRYFPTKLHSRDTAHPNFRNASMEDTGTLCGAIVSGPFDNTAGIGGPVRNGTDEYTNDRRVWRSSEAAIDYTSSLICGLMAYATMPDSLFEGCDARSPFTGRGI